MYPWKDRKKVATDLKLIYSAPTENQARRDLESFRDKWDKIYPTIGALWERNWIGERVTEALLIMKKCLHKIPVRLIMFH